jgi:hypothetical protein
MVAVVDDRMVYLDDGDNHGSGRRMRVGRTERGEEARGMESQVVQVNAYIDADHPDIVCVEMFACDCHNDVPDRSLHPSAQAAFEHGQQCGSPFEIRPVLVAFDLADASGMQERSDA